MCVFHSAERIVDELGLLYPENVEICEKHGQLIAYSWFNSIHGTKLKNCSSELFLINVVEINSALAAEGQRPSQWQAQPEASTKEDKRDLWLSAMIAVAPVFSSLEDRTIYTHWKPVWRSEIYRCFKSACGVQIYSSCENFDIGIPAKRIVDVCASRLQTCSCKSKMRI